ncbi:hypothetical protein MCOR27_000986 [Pyricularia oryzae]|uniref:Uncharacterized protein n=5 Tax=Pyricularia TaxID=48558 RepID=A0ABQ8P2S6_PYRGI|nr:uncharacterized protein MGG_17761 [Pyricularia oryzae 70-15]ELQ35803.1 hypothetical protein OOU_Y34scaffold00687g2 [Pyricularia oryzae Y34]KAH8846229.1 hypothetical protein MCOR01_003432 [Pyricularia oryzae]KAI6304446.1 hypothetical protein MCOR33_000540 [Pyricularia grisea]EHA47745.1 hypothetical protein MGG_17761 [Pyricularia oryzae 70-15]KAH9432263.1 hypothetical protein MCOR02_006966 [Pyricularia oryzae]
MRVPFVLSLLLVGTMAATPASPSEPSSITMIPRSPLDSQPDSGHGLHARRGGDELQIEQSTEKKQNTRRARRGAGTQHIRREVLE